MLTFNGTMKNLVLVYPTDNSGCSHVRLRFLGDYINANNLGLTFSYLNANLFDESLLAISKALIFQKPIGNRFLSVIRKYKAIQPKFGFKMIYELDDLIFSSPRCPEESIPTYNMAFQRRSKNPQAAREIEESLTQLFPLFDLVVTSTDYLADLIREKYPGTEVTVIKNTVPRFLWSAPKKRPIQEDLKKPQVLYSGASGHYLAPNPENPQGKLGDWDNPLREWVIKNVKDDKISFTVMGEFPFFFKELANKIRFIPWTNSYNYPRRCWSTGADFQIAPLVCNEFNCCKSALRFYESSISGMGFFGSVFKDPSKPSPYNEIHPDCKIMEGSSVEEIDEIFWSKCQRDPYNDLIKWQYSALEKGHILETSQAVNQWLFAIDSRDSLESI